VARSVGLPSQDFVVYYETRLGIRREANGDDGDEGPTPRGSDHAAGHRPAAARANGGGADLAVFEQFERMVRWLFCAWCLGSDMLLSCCRIGW